MAKTMLIFLPDMSIGAARRLILAALLAASLVSTTALAQQKDRNLYFQSPDGSINVIVSGGPG